jgi:hypothetical protein
VALGGFYLFFLFSSSKRLSSFQISSDLISFHHSFRFQSSLRLSMRLEILHADASARRSTRGGWHTSFQKWYILAKLQHRVSVLLPTYSCFHFCLFFFSEHLIIPSCARKVAKYWTVQRRWELRGALDVEEQTE